MKSFSVVFYNRNFTTKLDIPQSIAVERYSWNMMGGPKEARLFTTTDGDAWSLKSLIRCPVEIYSGDGKRVWYGYVNRVSIPHGPKQMWGVGLDAMFNSVKAAWSNSDGSGTTTASTDTVSIAEFGQKEYLLHPANVSQAVAERLRSLYLAQHKDLRVETEFSGGKNQVFIECKGWWSTLEWKYYTNTGTNNVENTTQIDAIVTDCGQFFNGTVIEHTSGMTSTEERDGNSTALAEINDLLDAGTTAIRPLLSRVDKDRILYVYERTAEPANPDYLLTPNGDLVTNLNAYVPPEQCVCAAWVLPQGLVKTGDMHPFFIENSEYSALQDITTYTPADAFEQHRLQKFIEDGSNGVSGKPGENGIPAGVGAISSLPYAWVCDRAVGGETYASRDIEIYATDWTTPVCAVQFRALTKGWYLVGGHLTFGSSGSGTINIGGGNAVYVPWSNNVPGGEVASGIYASVVTMGYAEAADIINITYQANSITQASAWIVKLSI